MHEIGGMSVMTACFRSIAAASLSEHFTRDSLIVVPATLKYAKLEHYRDEPLSQATILNRGALR